MDLTGEFAATQLSISRALVGVTRSATQASAQDTAFFRSLDPDLGASIDRQNARLLSLTQRLMRRCSPASDPQMLSLANAESIEMRWRTLVDVVDGLLERVDTCLDEYSGLIKRSSPKTGTSSPTPSQRSVKQPRNFRSHNIAKPQLYFNVKPSNDETKPFEPILTSKPHGITPLDQSRALTLNELGKLQCQHPYATEIARYDYPSFVYTEAEPQVYKPFETTTAKFVDDLEEVHQMVEELKRAQVISIDLEHHDAHSYVGIVSLMQISTREHDWLIDTLKPWRRELQILNEVFANPNILKVFHGAHMDIMWLQRDFGLYVVGLFDTHHASRVLGYAGGSLAFLLKKFINFDAQKQYQTADWRLRPLPKEMFDYARSDTHFLLYIYDCMRNELIAKSDLSRPAENKILDVLQRSKETALQRYEHCFYDMDQGLGRGGWLNLLQRTPAVLSKEQFAVFRKVHRWRDYVARREDESVLQILPNHTTFNVARTIPRDLPTLLSVLHPISHSIRSRASELLAVVHEATVCAVDEPELNETLSLIGRDFDGKHLSLSQEPTGKTKLATDYNLSLLRSANDRAESSRFWGTTLPIPSQKSLGSRKSTRHFEATPQISRPAIVVAATSPSNYERNIVSPSQHNYHTLSGSLEPLETNINNSSQNKRKAVEIMDESLVLSSPIPQPRNGNNPTLDNGEGPIIKKTENRAQRKAYKQPPFDAGSTLPAHGDSSIASTEPAFDYRAAPSVLRAKNARQGVLGHSTEEQTSYNLFTKGSGGRSGFGKARPSKVGRSATFK